jgi:hypothetical protein
MGQFPLWRILQILFRTVICFNIHDSNICSDIGRNFLLGNRKKIAKFLMRTFTCRSTFLCGYCYLFPERVVEDWSELRGWVIK